MLFYPAARYGRTTGHRCGPEIGHCLDRCSPWRRREEHVVGTKADTAGNHRDQQIITKFKADAGVRIGPRLFGEGNSRVRPAGCLTSRMCVLA
jgi:hypothetical protein